MVSPTVTSLESFGSWLGGFLLTFVQPERATQKTPFNHKAIMKKTNIGRGIFLLYVLALLGFAGAGCKHTANGAGQDIQNMGEKIQEKTQ